MKKLVAYLLLLFCSITFAQNKGFELLKKVNGIEIYYKTTISKEDRTKNTWVIEIEYINTSDTDLYYKSSVVNKNGVLGGQNQIIYTYFSSLTLENKSNISFISDSEVYLRGDKTKLQTGGLDIYRLKKGKTYTATMDLRLAKGDTPLISIQSTTGVDFVDDIKEFL